MATGQRETVEFDPNVVRRLALKYPTGRIVAGRNGDRVMFTTTDDRVFFLDLGLAQRINELRLKPGVPFTICRRQSGGEVNWIIGSTVGEQADGTFAVERLKDPAPPEGQARRAAEVPPAVVAPAQAAVTRQRVATKLENALKTAVAAAYAASEYAKSIGYAAMPQFTSEDLRTMANTLIIDAAKHQ